jgi:hypothetical protein
VRVVKLDLSAVPVKAAAERPERRFIGAEFRGEDLQVLRNDGEAVRRDRSAVGKGVLDFVGEMPLREIDRGIARIVELDETRLFRFLLRIVIDFVDHDAAGIGQARADEQERENQDGEPMVQRKKAKHRRLAVERAAICPWINRRANGISGEVSGFRSQVSPVATREIGIGVIWEISGFTYF